VVEPGDWLIELLEKAISASLYLPKQLPNPEQTGAASMCMAMFHEMLRPWYDGAMAVSLDGRHLLSITVRLDPACENVRRFVVHLWDLETCTQERQFRGTIAIDLEDLPVGLLEHLYTLLGPLERCLQNVMNSRLTRLDLSNTNDSGMPPTDPRFPLPLYNSRPEAPWWWIHFVRWISPRLHGELSSFIGESRYRPIDCLVPSAFAIQWALSADGRRALSGGDDGFLRLWDIRTGRLLRRFPIEAQASRCVALSRDGQLAACGVDNLNDGEKGFRLIVWDTRTGKLVHNFCGHDDWISCVAFSPDGQRILSGSIDRTVRLWNVHTGREAACFKGHTDPVMSIAFSPDGHFAVSGAGREDDRPGGKYDPVRLWRLPEE
jgi:WD40 repeat protein